MNKYKDAHYVAKILLSNGMSLVPKLTEVQEFIFRNEVGLAFFTETLLRESIADSVLCLMSYVATRHSRATAASVFTLGTI